MHNYLLNDIFLNRFCYIAIAITICGPHEDTPGFHHALVPLLSQKEEQEESEQDGACFRNWWKNNQVD